MFGVGFDEVVEGDGAEAGVVDVGGDGGGSVGGADGTGDEAGALGFLLLDFFDGLAGELCGGDVEFADVGFHLVVGL